ncbi:MAG TPA: GAF domain-containing protein [Actinomycetota bacterium]|nr:GAF domain-containing protein [Actinomycetota bacterium]
MPIDDQGLARGLQRLRAIATDTRHDGLAGALQDVVAATAAVFGVDGVALSLLDEQDVLRWVAASDPAVELVERAQLELGEGPCLEAVASDRVVATADLAGDGRWSRTGTIARHHRLRAVLAAPIRVDEVPMGSLSLYAREVRRWSGADLQAVEAYAAVVADLLVAELDREERGEAVGQLEHALLSRVLVEQAKGVLMARLGLGSRPAFEHLRRQAREQRRKLDEVAREVLATTQLDQAGVGMADAEDDWRRRPRADRRRHPGPEGEPVTRLTLLAAVTDAALADLDLDGVLVEVLEQVRAVLEVDQATVLLLTGDGQELEVRASVGRLDDKIRRGMRVALGAGVAGRIAAVGAGLLVEDLDEVDLANTVLRDAGLRCAAGVPLLARGRLLGVLHVGTRVPNGVGLDTLERLGVVAEPLALAIEHARRFQAGRATGQVARADRRARTAVEGRQGTAADRRPPAG